MAIPVGCHLITWHDRPVTEALDEIAAAGYTGVESNQELADEWKGKEEEFRQLLAARGLQLIALYQPEDWTDAGGEDSFAARADFLARFINLVGGRLLLLGPGPRIHPDGATDEDISHMALTMGAAAERAARHGVQTAVHPHWDTALQNRDEIDRLMAHTAETPLMLCVDTAHLARAGVDPVAVVTRYAGRVVDVHLKDLRGDTFVELGQGMLDLPAFVRALHDINYDGWVTVELDRSDRTPAESATMSRVYVEQMLRLPIRPTP